MTSIAAAEAACYTEVWQSLPSYARNSPGENLAPMFLEMAGLASGRGLTALDAGCGTGRGGVALAAHGFDVHLCDATDAGLEPSASALSFTPVSLWHDLRSQLPYLRGGMVDYVYCCDVLEHLPTEFTMLAVEQMLRIARKGVFLNISTVTDIHGVEVGRPLHLSCFPFVWWRDRLKELGTVVEARDLLISGAYLVRR